MPPGTSFAWSRTSRWGTTTSTSDACRDRGVAVTNTPGVLTNATAEIALGLTVAAARRAREAEAVLREGRWSGWDPGALLGLELSGATFGVVGLGRIGRRYAELVRPLAGEVLYAARSAKPDAEGELGAVRVELGELLERSDVVSLHAPGGEATSHLIGAGELARMRAHAVLVNTARGTLVDSIALAEALLTARSGPLGSTSSRTSRPFHRLCLTPRVASSIRTSDPQPTPPATAWQPSPRATPSP